jgi:hypothetical protein
MFTFKKNVSTGRYASFEAESHDIKLKRKVVGSIAEFRILGRRSDPDEGKFLIRLAVKRDRTKENPVPFKWITLKHRVEDVLEAKKLLNDNFEAIVAKYDLHSFE